MTEDRLLAAGSVVVAILVAIAIAPTLLDGATSEQRAARVVVILAWMWTLLSAGYLLGSSGRAKS